VLFIKVTVGTQAAVLASLDVTMFIEFQPPPDSEWMYSVIPRGLKFLYYTLITVAFCCNLLVVAQTTLLSVLGTALALRGPDGSMIWATDGLYHERKSIFYAFGMGLATTISSVLVVVWLILSPEASAVCMSITLFTVLRLYKSYLRMVSTFEFDESETVDFTDIFESGPAAITVVPSSIVKRGGSTASSRISVASSTIDPDGYSSLLFYTGTNHRTNSNDKRKTTSTRRRTNNYESFSSSEESWCHNDPKNNDKYKNNNGRNGSIREKTPILTV
jgi:hypothetical protein